MSHDSGGNCVKYLKRGLNEGRGNKDLKRGGKLGQGVGALKRGAGTPLWTMVYMCMRICTCKHIFIHTYYCFFLFKHIVLVAVIKFTNIQHCLVLRFWLFNYNSLTAALAIRKKVQQQVFAFNTCKFEGISTVKI